MYCIIILREFQGLYPFHFSISLFCERISEALSITLSLPFLWENFKGSIYYLSLPFLWENFKGSIYYLSLPFFWENFRGSIYYLSIPLLPHPIFHVSKILPSVVFGMSPGGVPLFWLSLSVTISVWQEVVGGIWWGSLWEKKALCVHMAASSLALTSIQILFLKCFLCK